MNELVRKFGAFTAVDHLSFSVRRGEIFGLLGPNGAGKTTTFRMLCGLLPATSGTLRVAGFDLRTARASARQRIGYVAQKFSLYGQLSVAENLDFFASAYGLHGSRKRERIEWALAQFELEPLMRLASGQLPGGYKQRLAMAAALLHEPEILFLDEPTSGADPLARREFWQRITLLAQQDVTVIVTTHFMEEAEYCDRIAILDAGRMLAEGTPGQRAQSRRVRGRPPRNHGGRLHRHRRSRLAEHEPATRQITAVRRDCDRQSFDTPARAASGAAKLRRVAALVRKETYQLFRDPSSIAIGVFMPAMLILLFGYALSLDVKNVPVAVVLEAAIADRNRACRAFSTVALFRGTTADFDAAGAAASARQKVDGIVRIRSDFARRLRMGDGEVQVLVNGSRRQPRPHHPGLRPGRHRQFLAQRAAEGQQLAAGGTAVRAEPTLVQRSRRQPLFPRPGPHRPDHDR